MKIYIENKPEDDYGEGGYYSLEMLDNTNKVIGSFDVCSMSECPEDALLSRGLGFVYKIPTLLQKAWQAGGDEGSGTRSSLMYETLRIVEKLKPKCVIWENVKNLLSKKT